MLVKPNTGLKVRDPALKDFLPDDGREVDDNDLYWQRRLRDQDVVLVTEQSTDRAGFQKQSADSKSTKPE